MMASVLRLITEFMIGNLLIIIFVAIIEG